MFRVTSKNDSALARSLDRAFAVITFDLDGIIQSANANFLNAVGYGAHEIVGKHHRIFMPAADAADPAYEAFWTSLRKGDLQSGQFRRIARDGRDIWLQATYNPVLDRSGKTVKIVKIAADITAEKNRALDSAGQLEAIDRSQAVISFDMNGHVLDANDNFLVVMGYGLDEIRGQHHRLLVDPQEADGKAYKEFWDSLREGRFQTAEYRRIAKGGREVWIRASYNPIVDDEGRVIKVVKFALDVTQEKIRNADYEGQIAAINTTQAVISFTLDGTIVDANANFLKATGYHRDEVVGHHHRMFVEPSYATTDEYAQFWRELATGKAVSAIYQRFGKGGRPIWLQATYNPIFNAAGQPVKVVKYATDISTNMSARSRAVSSAEETLSNVEDVAYAAQEMDGAIGNIVNAMERSKSAVDEIHTRTEVADRSTVQMRNAAQAMDDVVQLIAKIADQINLLALNATIESARAGEAGRGFAVVANEVKNLARQASDATTRISNEIKAVQSVSNEVVSALSAITGSVGDVQGFVDEAAHAIREQSVISQNISSSMRTAADGVASIGRTLDDWIVGMEERRFDERERVVKSATILVPGRAPISCSLRNISKSGAKILVRSGEDVPARIDLQIEGEARPRPCAVLRREGSELGLKFLDANADARDRAA